MQCAGGWLTIYQVYGKGRPDIRKGRQRENIVFVSQVGLHWTFAYKGDRTDRPETNEGKRENKEIVFPEVGCVGVRSGIESGMIWS